MSDPDAFYDELADDYHLVYADWQRSVRWQGDGVDRLIRTQLGDRRATILDCSCGIGTQAIGLALHGHRVHATDISARAVERARREASVFDVDLTFGVADMREVADAVPGTFDVVLSCDNSVPHLLDDADILAALGSMRQKLSPDGLLIIGIRDYDALVAERPRFTPPRLTGTPEQRAIIVQLWDWANDDTSYDLTLFITRETDNGWQTTARATRYRALRRDDLARLLTEAGYAEIYWHEPDAIPHHQPIVTARARDPQSPSS